MRGAPQVGFSATVRKIRARTSLLTRFRPPTCLTLESHAQYKRHPARCQLKTVLGVTRTRRPLHPDQHVLNADPAHLVQGSHRHEPVRVNIHAYAALRPSTPRSGPGHARH